MYEFHWRKFCTPAARRSGSFRQPTDMAQDSGEESDICLQRRGFLRRFRSTPAFCKGLTGLTGLSGGCHCENRAKVGDHCCLGRRSLLAAHAISLRAKSVSLLEEAVSSPLPRRDTVAQTKASRVAADYSVLDVAPSTASSLIIACTRSSTLQTARPAASLQTHRLDPDLARTRSSYTCLAH